MRQLKNCKIGSFVLYEGEPMQLNCRYKTMGKELAKLVPLRKDKKGYRTLKNPETSEKVEVLGQVEYFDKSTNILYKTKSLKELPF